MRMASEDDILGLIARFFPEDHPALLLGRGDDCAVLRPGGPLALTTDVFAEDAHFRRRYFTPFDIGFKSVAVNVSDVGASGARPVGISMGLTLTGREDEAWLRSGPLLAGQRVRHGLGRTSRISAAGASPRRG